MSNKTNPLENLEEELVDYVSNTPNNTNPSVVKSMVRAAADDVSTGGGEPLVVILKYVPDVGLQPDKPISEILATVQAHKPIVVEQTNGPSGRFEFYLHSYAFDQVSFWTFAELSASTATIQLVTLFNNGTSTTEEFKLTAATA